MATLPAVGHAHHAVLMPHVDALASLAEELEISSLDELRRRVASEHAFITGQLIPHIDRAEEKLYPELERLMQNRHSMTPMRREHGELRRLVEEFGELIEHELTFESRLRLRRVLYRMHAILKVHLGEEQAYLNVLAGNLSVEEQEGLARAMEHATAM
jgi:hypothetical protein